MASPPPPTPLSSIGTVPLAAGRYATQGMISPVEPPFVDATTGTLTPVSFRFLYDLWNRPAGGGGTPGPPGPQGPAGPAGPAGSAATVNVGTTTTGTPGTPANVTNSGSSSAAVFNFTIPQGLQGSTGATGATGPAGPQGPNWLVGPGLALNTATTPNTVDVATPYLPISGGTVTGNFTVSGATTLAAATGQTVAAADNSTALATTAFVKSQNYLTANQTITISGDASGAGTTAIPLTLATVNSNVGTWNNLTVNAKGLVTAGSNVAYLTGNQTVTLSGDLSGSGATAIAGTVTGLQGHAVSSTAPSTNQVLTWNGSAWAPATPAAPGTGTVTSVTAGTGLTGGTITTSGTIALATPVAIANGGTNATTAAAALTNLGAAPTASPTFTGTVTIPTGANIATPNITGVTNGSNAAAGQVGEYLTANMNQAVPASTNANVGSITLTPGDWDVGCNLMLTSGGTTTLTQIQASLSTTASAQGSPNVTMQMPASGQWCTPLPQYRFNVTSNTTVYCTCLAAYSNGVITATGNIWARRAR